MAARKWIRIVHRPSGTIIASGATGWAITPFEGNYYISASSLRASGFRPNWIPGLCPYKGLYVWLDFHAPDGSVLRSVAWKYVVPNPVLPFIWFRVAVPGGHPDFSVEVTEAPRTASDTFVRGAARDATRVNP